MSPPQKIWALQMSGRLQDLKQGQRNHPIHLHGIPDVKIVSGIHGNENVGREATLIYAKQLCELYKKNDAATVDMLNHTSIHFIFDVNPDGYSKAHRQKP